MRILFVLSKKDDIKPLIVNLRRGGINPICARASTEEELSAAQNNGPLDAVIVKHPLPQFSALAALTLSKNNRPELPVIIVSHPLKKSGIAAAIRSGADDVLTENELDRLGPSLLRAARAANDQPMREHLPAISESLRTFGDVSAGERSKITVRASLDNIRNLEQALNTHSAVSTTDSDGVIIQVNDKFCQLVKYSREELIGKNHCILNSGYHPKEFWQGFWKTINEGRIFKGEIRDRAKDGSFFWMAVTVVPFLTREGKPYQFVCIRTDITQQKSDREKIESIARFPDENPNPILRVNRDGTLLYANPGSRSLLACWGIREGDRLPKAYSELVRESLQSDSGKETEFSCTDHTFQATIVPVREHGYANIFTNDISKQKEAELELREAQENLFQSQKFEAVGRLAGGIAHDFNNLLTPILGSASFLRDALPKDDPRLEDVDEIENAGKRAASLTKQLLAFSRRQVLKPEVLDLNRVIRDILGLLRRTTSENIEIKTNLDSGLWETKADSAQLGQVLMNLAVNSADAMSAGGIILIETSNISFPKSCVYEKFTIPAGDYAVISVTDTGEGIPRELQTVVFEPFFTTKKSGKGTGLGLSTVYGIIKQSGGFVTLYSEPGHGATFKIYLPVTKESLAASKKPLQSKESLTGSETIMVVEDDPSVLKNTSRILETWGYKVHSASSGEAALRLVAGKGSSFHLLLTDIMMPGIDGVELARRVTLVRPSTKVILTSGYPGDVIAQRKDTLPGSNFISKPFSPRALASLVRRVLDS